MVLSVGEILIDRFSDGNSISDKPGGAPFNVACGIAHLGADVSFYGVIGDDAEGSSLESFADSIGFSNLRLVKRGGKKTTVALVTLKDGERSFRFEREDATDALFDLDEFYSFLDLRPTLVHFGSLLLCYPFGREFLRAAVDECHRRGILTSFDVNYREDIFAGGEEARSIYQSLVPTFDIVKISDEETAILYPDGFTPRKDQLLVESLGKRGSIALYRGQTYKASTHTLKPVDTTGAGDAFYACFLFAVERNGGIEGLDIQRALHYANAAGALATQKVGAISSLPSLSEVTAFAYGEKVD